ncbi:hypothetical protein GCM10022260_04230 [Gaetbulibacter aestuarii]
MVKEIEKAKKTDGKTDSIINLHKEKFADKNVVERYFPKENEITEFDTIIAAKNLKISIENKTLDTYVTNEFESQGTKYIDKYRDYEKHLIINLANQRILDTVFNKKDFDSLAGQDFLKIANFHAYWFNKMENDTLEFFGVISKPETDISFAFYHFFDLKSRTFEIKEFVDEKM